jgi:hypothetical protein
MQYQMPGACVNHEQTKTLPHRGREKLATPTYNSSGRHCSAQKTTILQCAACLDLTLRMHPERRMQTDNHTIGEKCTGPSMSCVTVCVERIPDLLSMRLFSIGDSQSLPCSYSQTRKPDTKNAPSANMSPREIFALCMLFTHRTWIRRASLQLLHPFRDPFALCAECPSHQATGGIYDCSARKSCTNFIDVCQSMQSPDEMSYMFHFGTASPGISRRPHSCITGAYSPRERESIPSPAFRLSKNRGTTTNCTREHAILTIMRLSCYSAFLIVLSQRNYR